MSMQLFVMPLCAHHGHGQRPAVRAVPALPARLHRGQQRVQAVSLRSQASDLGDRNEGVCVFARSQVG